LKIFGWVSSRRFGKEEFFHYLKHFLDRFILATLALGIHEPSGNLVVLRDTWRRLSHYRQAQVEITRDQPSHANRALVDATSIFGRLWSVTILL
jgi:hypothetical protein